jgi:hypothetical protein
VGLTSVLTETEVTVEKSVCVEVETSVRKSVIVIVIVSSRVLVYTVQVSNQYNPQKGQRKQTYVVNDLGVHNRAEIGRRLDDGRQIRLSHKVGRS